MPADDDGLRAEAARLRAALEAERLSAREWREVAEERRASLERLRGDPALRRLLHAAGVVLPPLRRARHEGARVYWPARRLVIGALGAPYRLTAGRRERSLRERLARLPPAPPSSRRVSVIVLTHDGADHLARLLPALRSRTAHEHCEVIVVDNDSGPATRALLDAQPDVRVLRSARNRSFSAANNLAAAEASGDALVFLNDDVEPLSPAWLPRMLALLHGDTVAVGAQLVYPRRGLLDSHTRDVGVQHRGVDLRPVPGGMPRPVNVGGGADPDPGAPPAEVAAATAACLLVDRAAFDAVGGFDEGYVYGAEDVDLCWRLRERGGRVMVAHDAVCLHPEGATRLRADRPSLRRRQARNWRRLAERHGPAIARAVALDRIDGRNVLSAAPYRVEVTVPPTRDGGGGAALELAAGLRAFGWDVRAVSAARAALRPGGRADAVVATSPGALRARRRGATTVAFVAGDAVRWLSAPDAADAVLAMGEDVASTLREHGRHRPTVVAAGQAPAEALRGVLRERARRASFVLRTSAPDRRSAPSWGDWHLAEGLARELRAAGHPTLLQTADEWGHAAGHVADVAVHLKGHSVAPRAAGQLHVVWCISRPRELTPEECDAADLVLVASERFAGRVRASTSTPVGVLLQATDERRFRPRPPDPRYRHQLAFVGNSRFVLREAVRAALAAGLRPAIYGANWEPYVDAELVEATFVPNEELPVLYSSVDVLLNDHWEDMRRHGFVANRVFDALACGTVVLSDPLPELGELFGDAVATYTGPDDLAATVRGLLDDPAPGRERAWKGRAVVLESHTFRVRAGQLLEHLRPLSAGLLQE